MAPCMPASLHHLPPLLFHSRYEKSTMCPLAGGTNGALQFSGAGDPGHSNRGATSTGTWASTPTVGCSLARRGPPSAQPATRAAAAIAIATRFTPDRFDVDAPGVVALVPPMNSLRFREIRSPS